MPGILPMKVIKVGSNAQARIAQACDRCRSKKIRCDGIRPSCTQCINVGFECKTSDKLSRRAFPRGYTESLEERVRALEAEVRELKNLLDDRDEKLDMLSRMRSRTSPPFSSPKGPSDAGTSPTLTADAVEPCQSDGDETFKVMQSPTLVDDCQPNSFFMGTSSARPLVCAFKRKLQEQGKSAITFNIDSFFSSDENKNDTASNISLGWAAPARMLSDKLVNIFFQEFSPLFPILHRPTFLALYDEYTSTPDIVKDTKSIAQLFLVFGIAGLSSQSGASQEDVTSFEAQWKWALESFISEDCLTTLQCLALATLYHMVKGEYSCALKYRGHAITLAQRLGLHQSQKRFNFGALTVETRKKVFWTIYTLDCFSAAHLGLPTLLTDTDIHCELPVDADDEYVSENGFLPTLPGESTKLSSALALFKLSRVLSRILKQLYPANTSQELSFRKIAELQDELDTWSSELAPHLRLRFEKDKPFTGVISSRSPLLSLAYHYSHTLISRPAVLASPSLQSRSNASILSLALSSKRVIQIVQLLEERNMAFAFCLNKNEVLLQSAFGLLFQSLEMVSEGVVSREDSKLIAVVTERVETNDLPGAREFRKIVDYLLKDKTLRSHRQSADGGKTSRAEQKQKNTSRRALKVLTARSSPPGEKKSETQVTKRRTTFPHTPSSSQLSLFRHSSSDTPTVYQQPPLFARSESSLSQSQGLSRIAASQTSRRQPVPNLDYLPFNEKPPISISLANDKDESSPADWEQILSNLDNGPINIYDTIYGGPGAQPPSLGDYSSLASSSPKIMQSSNADDAMRNSSCSPHSLWTPVPDYTANPQVAVPQSVLSFGSDETAVIAGDDGFDHSLVIELPGDAFSSSLGIHGVNSPNLLGSNNDVDLFGGLDFGLGI